MSSSMNNSISPEDLVKSLLESTFVGQSAAEAVDGCIRYLKKFRLNATTMSLKSGGRGDAPTGHGQFFSNTTRYNQKLYCEHCTTHNKHTYHANGDVFKCTVIAVVDLINDKNNEDLWDLKLRKLYPHYCCDKEIMNMKTGVGGWTTIDIDFNSIIGNNTFRHVLDQLYEVQIDDLMKYQSKFGKLITSGCSENHYPHDIRFQIPMHHRDCPVFDDIQGEIDDYYNLNDEIFLERYHCVRVRLALLLANTLGIATELICFSEPFCEHNIVPNNSSHDITRHLTIDQGSIIWGGMCRHHDDSRNNQIPQVPHTDFGANDKHEYISDNNLLTGLTNPGVIHIPLVSPRKLLLHVPSHDGTQTFEETVQKGQIFVVDGTVVHSGFTFNADTSTNPLDLQPSLHFYLNSTLHPCDLSGFTTCRKTAGDLRETFAPLYSTYPDLADSADCIIEQLTNIEVNFNLANNSGALRQHDRSRIVYKLQEMAKAISGIDQNVASQNTLRRSKRLHRPSE